MRSIVIDARMVQSSGIGVYLKHLIPYLCIHFKVTLLGKEAELAHLKKQSSVTIIPLSASVYSVREQVALFVKIPVCDLFWSPQYNIPLLPIRAGKRVVTIHDTYHLAYQHTLSVPQKTYANGLLRVAVKRSDQVVTVSSFSAQEIKKFTHCPAEKLEVITNGVDHQLFTAGFSENDRKTLHERLEHLPEKYILFVGNVKPHKNLISLLRAYALLPPHVRKQYGLVVVGKKEGFITPDQEVFRFLQQEPTLGQQIQFTGFVPDALLTFLYKCASLFVFPSVYEGFGLPPLEAMACGCPVLASNAASLPEVCGAAALYFNPLAEEELSRLMEKVLGNQRLREELVQKGFQQVQKFSWEASANQHLQLFHRVMKST